MKTLITARRGESSASSVAIVAIIILVLIGLYLIFFRGNADAPEAPGPDINVSLPGDNGGAPAPAAP